MLVTLLLLQCTTLVFANPFHKYPYTFLLDVGNEELEKVNTEQIRLSKQGGSLALRYPAIGNGEDIAHIRVSGIDFGTDLKANIVDGGPGYKYVVLVLMGNPGVAYDAVITVKTMPNQNSDGESLQNLDSNDDDQVSENNDPNDSAEDLNDSDESKEASQVSVMKENSELTQESSNVYSYAVNEALSGYGNNVHSSGNDEDEVSDSHINNSDIDNDADENYSDLKDIHVPIKVDQIQTDEDSEAQLEDYTSDENSESTNEKPNQEVQHINNDYSTVGDDQNYAHDNGNHEQIDGNLYEDYQILKQNMYNEEAYSQIGVPDDSGTVYIEEPGDNEGALNLEEIFGDDYEDEDDRKYYSNTNSNDNNNFIDKNDGLAVAY